MTIDIKKLLSRYLLNNNDSFIRYVYQEAFNYDESNPENTSECDYKSVETDTYNLDFRFGDTRNPKIGDIVITDVPIVQEGLEGNPVVNYVVIEHKDTGLNFLFREWLNENSAFYQIDDKRTEFLGVVKPKTIEYKAFEVVESIDTLKDSLLKYLNR